MNNSFDNEEVNSTYFFSDTGNDNKSLVNEFNLDDSIQDFAINESTTEEDNTDSIFNTYDEDIKENNNDIFNNQDDSIFNSISLDKENEEFLKTMEDNNNEAEKTLDDYFNNDEDENSDKKLDEYFANVDDNIDQEKSLDEYFTNEDDRPINIFDLPQNDDIETNESIDRQKSDSAENLSKILEEYNNDYNNYVVENNNQDEINNTELKLEEEQNNNSLDEEIKKDEIISNDSDNRVDLDPYVEFDSSINELDKSTDYIKDDEDLTTDINNLFMQVNSNVKEASDIFTKNVEMKKIIDKRFDELKELQANLEASRKADFEEINNYKEEVLSKLNTKKDEIEERLSLLKKLQSEFEKEKEEFENYRRDEEFKIQDAKKKNNESFDERKAELSRIEEKLRKQKDSLDEDRRNLSLDQIQYETDKNELANNMIKFNEIVSKFTNGIDKIN